MKEEKKLANYSTMDKVELINIIEKKDIMISELKKLNKMYDGTPNDVIDRLLDGLVFELSTLFKMPMDDILRLHDKLRETINSFIR